MRESTKDRAVALGEYILQTGATVRAAAKVFKISKSTVHTAVTIRNGLSGSSLNKGFFMVSAPLVLSVPKER